MDILQDNSLEEFGLKGCSLKVSEGECFVDILLVVKRLKGPFRPIGESLGHPCSIWVPSKCFCKGFNVPKFQAIATVKPRCASNKAPRSPLYLFIRMR